MANNYSLPISRWWRLYKPSFRQQLLDWKNIGCNKYIMEWYIITKIQHWFRKWHGAEQAACHFLSQYLSFISLNGYFVYTAHGWEQQSISRFILTWLRDIFSQQHDTFESKFRCVTLSKCSWNHRLHSQRHHYQDGGHLIGCDITILTTTAIAVDTYMYAVNMIIGTAAIRR